MESKNINLAREQLANTEGIPWFSVYLFSFVLVFFCLSGFCLFLFGGAVFKREKIHEVGWVGRQGGP